MTVPVTVPVVWVAFVDLPKAIDPISLQLVQRPFKEGSPGVV